MFFEVQKYRSSKQRVLTGQKDPFQGLERFALRKRWLSFYDLEDFFYLAVSSQAASGLWREARLGCRSVSRDGSPPKRAPGPESGFTCRHYMQAPGRQQLQRGVYYQGLLTKGSLMVVVLPPSRSLGTPEFGVPSQSSHGLRKRF